jgi:hypothetical protein
MLLHLLFDFVFIYKCLQQNCAKKCCDRMLCARSSAPIPCRCVWPWKWGPMGKEVGTAISPRLSGLPGDFFFRTQTFKSISVKQMVAIIINIYIIYIYIYIITIYIYLDGLKPLVIHHKCRHSAGFTRLLLAEDWHGS